MASKNTTMPARWKFWESYANALEVLADEDEEKAKDFLWKIYRYSSWGKQPEFNDSSLAMSWELIKPNLDNSVKAHANGNKGKKTAQANQRRSEQEKDEIRRAKKLSNAMGKLYAEYETEYIPPADWSDEEDYISADVIANLEAMKAEAEADIDPNELWG